MFVGGGARGAIGLVVYLVAEGGVFESFFVVFLKVLIGATGLRCFWTDRGYHTHQQPPYTWFLKSLLLEQRLTGCRVVHADW